MTGHPAVNSNVEHDPSRQTAGFTLVELLVVICVVFILIAFLLPARRSARPAARRSQCTNNLKQIGIALHGYHDVYHTFPPAYTVDASGRRLHSWRTLILPFLEQQSLYDLIDLSKPWDDPANAEAFNATVPNYRCPAIDRPPNHTTYVATAAPDACICSAEPRALSDITDPYDQTLLLIEVDSAHSVPWMAPVDADEKSFLDIGPKSALAHAEGMNVLFVDGSARFLNAETSAAVRRTLITIAGNDKSAREF